MDAEQIINRIRFLEDLDIMEVDFSNLVFNTTAEVNLVYDCIEKLVQKTDRKWFFMVNYNNTRIQPEAWFQYAVRGKSLNVSSSLGSVRFDAAEPTRLEIEKRAKSEDFNPNLVSTREEALERINEMRAEAAT